MISLLQIRIPDDRSSRSQFALIDDELDLQLRDILEGKSDDDEHAGEDDSPVFKRTRAQYKACMDLDRLEEKGLEPLKEMLARFGGWPVVEGDQWDEEAFNW